MESYLSGNWAKEAITNIYNDLLDKIEKGQDITFTIRKKSDDKGGFIEFNIISRMKPEEILTLENIEKNQGN